MSISLLKNIHGAPVIILIFAGVSLLTQFNYPFYFAYLLYSIYAILYILLKLKKNAKLKVENKKVFTLHIALVVYVLMVFFFIELSDLSNTELPHLWERNSTLVYLSILLANIVILISPKRNIFFSLNLIKYISYYLVVEAFLYYVLPDSINVFRSDHEAGYRCDGLLLNSYTKTALFLILGYIIDFQLCKNISKKRAVFTFLLFFFALLATKDRASILTFLVLNMMIYYRSTFSYSTFSFKTKKRTLIINSFLMFVVLPFLLLSNFVERENPFSLKSTLSRIALDIRSLEITDVIMPLGSGPGSQVRLIYSNKIETNILDTSVPFIDDYLKDEMLIEKKHIASRIGRGESMSPHNTYFDHLISLGIFGLLIILLIFYEHIKSMFKLVFLKQNRTIFFDAFLFSSIILFMYTSLINVLFVYILIIKSRVIFIKNDSKLCCISL